MNFAHNISRKNLVTLIDCLATKVSTSSLSLRNDKIKSFPSLHWKTALSSVIKFIKSKILRVCAPGSSVM